MIIWISIHFINKTGFWMEEVVAGHMLEGKKVLYNHR